MKSYSMHFPIKQPWGRFFKIIRYLWWEKRIQYFNLPLYRNSDILIGALDENDFTNEHYVASHPYYYDTITWCTQKQKPIPRWMGFFYLCTDPIVLVMAFFTCIFAVFVGYYIQQFEKKKWDSLTLAFACLRIMIGLAIPIDPKILSGRVFLISTVLIHIVTTTFLVSFVLKAINNPPLKNQVASIKEIVDKKSPFELVGDRFALEHLKKQNEVDIL